MDMVTLYYFRVEAEREVTVAFRVKLHSSLLSTRPQTTKRAQESFAHELLWSCVILILPLDVSVYTPESIAVQTSSQ